MLIKSFDILIMYFKLINIGLKRGGILRISIEKMVEVLVEECDNGEYK